MPLEPVLHPGDSHPNVVLLRQRLRQLAYLPRQAPDTELYDETVEAAVRRLQRDHGLDVDGVVGRQSFDILNLTLAEKINQLRINLGPGQVGQRDDDGRFHRGQHRRLRVVLHARRA